MNHPFEPVYDENSTILILGTFPSVKSRETSFYYGNPQNRFWKTISRLTGEAIPETIEEKKRILLKHYIAIWDVVESCDIKGSSDSSIEHVVPNDLASIIRISKIERIYANGNKAFELYRRYCYDNIQQEIIKLPSTSPANAAYSVERLVECWGQTISME
ncbi:MAG: DNA-deoxyinosine glycosylase [Erysipelotrichaceae bacterium]